MLRLEPLLKTHLPHRICTDTLTDPTKVITYTIDPADPWTQTTRNLGLNMRATARVKTVMLAMTTPDQIEWMENNWIVSGLGGRGHSVIRGRNNTPVRDGRGGEFGKWLMWTFRGCGDSPVTIAVSAGLCEWQLGLRLAFVRGCAIRKESLDRVQDGATVTKHCGFHQISLKPMLTYKTCLSPTADPNSSIYGFIEQKSWILNIYTRLLFVIMKFCSVK